MDNKVVLSEEEKEVIRKKVEKKLEKEARDRASDSFEKELITKAKKKELMKDAKAGDPDENGLVPVFIDLPGVSECIRLDGIAYYPQRMYYVSPEKRDVILECMGRGREHEDSLNGKTAKENLYRRKGNVVVK